MFNPGTIVIGGLHIHVGVSMLEGDVLEEAHAEWDIARGPAETLDTRARHDR